MRVRLDMIAFSCLVVAIGALGWVWGDRRFADLIILPAIVSLSLTGWLLRCAEGEASKPRAASLAARKAPLRVRALLCAISCVTAGMALAGAYLQKTLESYERIVTDVQTRAIAAPVEEQLKAVPVLIDRLRLLEQERLRAATSLDEFKFCGGCSAWVAEPGCQT